MAERVGYLLWGSAGHALVLNEAIRRLNGHVVALFDNSEEVRSVLPGVPLVGGTSELPDWIESRGGGADLLGLVAVGGQRGRERLLIQAGLASHGIISPCLIHPHAFVAEGVVFGAGTQVLAGAVVAAGANVGAACIINHRASVDHECRLADGVHIAPGAILCGCVDVGPCSMVGAGAVVLPRVRIGADCVIGAGAVVTHDVPERATVVGVPAKPIR